MTTRELIRNYLSSFATAEPDSVVRHVTENFENIQVNALGKGCVGKALYRQRLVDFLTEFEDLRYDVEDIIVDGDKAAVTYQMLFNRNGWPIKIAGVMVLTVQRSLIAVRKDYWDGLDYQNQLPDN